jgi:hypothetical protein
MRKLRGLCAAIAMLFACGAAGAEEAEIDLYDLGHTLARCAGFYKMAASIAQKAGKPAAADHLSNLHRGWMLAGAYAIGAAGEGKSVVAQPVQVATGLADSRATELLAKLELDPGAVLAMKSEHDRVCEPLTPYQVKLVDMMRRSAAGVRP